MAENILSPVGRMVQGHPMVMTGQGFGNKPLTNKDGQPREECFFAVAFPKTDPIMAQIWQQLQQAAIAGFPGGQAQWPTFSWKVKDGDQPPHNTKEGFPGHYVISFKSGFMPKVFTKGGAAQIAEKSQLKCGDYVRVYFGVAANNDKAKPGLFINPSVVELVGYGSEIFSGPDGTVFGDNPVAALPPGASATPVAGPPIATAPPVMGAPAGFGPPAAPPAGFGPPATGITPAPDFLTPPPAGFGPPAPPPALAHQMTTKAAGATYESFRAAGWTDAQLIAQGYMDDDIPF